MPISPIRLYKLYTYTQYILIHAITLYGKLAYTWYMLILDIPLYVVDVHMTTGLYSSIVYRYTIVIWLYKKNADTEPAFSSVSAQQDKRCYSQKSSSDGWLSSI